MYVHLAFRKYDNLDIFSTVYSGFMVYQQHIPGCCPANVNMKHYGSHSNFGLTHPIISFWWPEQLPVVVVMNKPHLCVVNNTYPGTWRPHTKFQLDWSLAARTTSYGCGYDKITPLSYPNVVNNAHPDTWRPHVKLQPGWSFNLLLTAKITPCGCGYDKTTPTATLTCG